MMKITGKNSFEGMRFCYQRNFVKDNRDNCNNCCCVISFQLEYGVTDGLNCLLPNFILFSSRNEIVKEKVLSFEIKHLFFLRFLRVQGNVLVLIFWTKVRNKIGSVNQRQI